MTDSYEQKEVLTLLYHMYVRKFPKVGDISPSVMFDDTISNADNTIAMLINQIISSAVSIPYISNI